jgi:integrase
MGVKIQKPGEPGHPGGNRRIYVRVNYGGHRKTRVFNTSKGAQEYATQVEAMLKLGKADEVFREPAPRAPAPTFKEAAERWLAVDGAAFKPSTREDYQSILKTHILSTFGTRPLDSITRTEIEDWWAIVRAKGLSLPTVSPIRTVLTNILKRAVASGIIPANPAEVISGRIGREDREVRQVEWLTEPELTRLLTVTMEREPRYHPLLLTIASTGLRLGEAVGLQVGDVDLVRDKLYIRRAVRKRQVSSPKSGKPRTVDVPPSTIAVLRGWIDVVRAEAAVRGEEGCWLFPSATGKPVDEPLIRDALARALKAAGIRRQLRVHSLRHGYASLALQRGVPLLTVSRQLGHASIAITADVYGHLAADATKEAAVAWEAILTEPGRNLGATQTPDPA